MCPESFEALRGQQIFSAIAFRNALRARSALSEEQEALVIALAEVYPTTVTSEQLVELDRDYLGSDRTAAVDALAGRRFWDRWQLTEALTAHSDEWKPKLEGPLTKDYNKRLGEMYGYLFRHLHRVDD